MKKKILIVINSFYLGGIEKALVSLLNRIPQNKYEVFLMPLENIGFSYNIPKFIHIIYAPFKFSVDVSDGVKSVLKQEIKGKKWYNTAIIFTGYIFSRLFHNNSILKKSLFKNVILKFDYVFNFRGPSLIPSIICEDICISEKKYIRIHFDYFLIIKKHHNKLFHVIVSSIKNIILKYKYKNILKYNYIFCVSNEIYNKLNRIYATGNIKILYNIIDKGRIQRLGNKKGFNDKFNGLRILSVGRLFYIKGFDIACDVCKQLIDKGHNIRWYVIGDGKEWNNLKNLIRENNMEKYFILLGSMSNPYPYFKGCDIYVQSSRSEAFCLALAEAKIFNKPIVATKFSGASEQIRNKSTGLLVDIDPQKIEEAIESLIMDERLRKDLSNNLKNDENDKTVNAKFSDLEQFM